ncbi:hypothetical protein [Streptomyces sp. NPDC096934]|uniref:hypothetical protein n=1 Tax=Streptomyces sp. NPDC096934 TaxID=3155551 RepID=UPI003316CB34
MVLPWVPPELPGSHVQLDFVYNEQLPGNTVVQAATPELSLAWKLMWPSNDMHAQGKDLHDAVLLAEHHPLRYELQHEVFRLSGEWPYPHREKIRLEDVTEAVGYVEWNNFVTEYPQFKETEREYAARLERAVTKTFKGAVD